MKIGVVGAGSIGTVFAASLGERNDVRVLVRDGRTAREIASRGGLVVDGMSPVSVRVSHEASALADCALVIVAVKTYATVAALEPLRAALRGDATILSVQNGIDAAAQIACALGRGRAIAVGPTTEAARLIEPGVVLRASRGETTIGWAEPRSLDAPARNEIVRTLEDAGLRARAVDDPQPYLWAKLVVNAAINPVTALARVTNGELLERPELLARAFAIAAEVIALAERERIALPFDDAFERVRAVASATAHNRSSMLQDVERGWPTEIDAILGTVVRRAATYGLNVSACRTAYDEVRRLTNA